MKQMRRLITAKCFNYNTKPFLLAASLSNNAPSSRSYASPPADDVILRAKLAALTTDDLMAKALQYNKQYIPLDQRQGVKVLLEEVLYRRTAVLNVKGFRDVLTLANLSEHHSLALEIFHKRQTSHSTDPKFTVYDVVVESAYALKDADALEEIAMVCSRKLRVAPREVISDFSLARCLWRCICLLSDTEQPLAIQKAASTASERIWSNAIVPAIPDIGQRITYQTALKETRRHILYSSHEEQGEMAFFLMCKQKGILKTSLRPLSELRNNETYYCALIRTCRSGCFSDVAMEYFEELRSASTATMLKRVVGTATLESAVSEAEIAEVQEDKRTAMEGASEEERALFESLGVNINQTAPVAAPSTAVSSSNTIESSTQVASSLEEPLDDFIGGLTEVVVFAVVAVLHAAKDNQRIVNMGKSLLSDGAGSLSPSILATLAVAGGEVKDLPFVLSCYQEVLKRQAEAGSKPVPFIMYSCLSAISKCHVKDFVQQYLEPCQAKGLITDDMETCTYLILQNAMGSVNPLEVIGPIIHSALTDDSYARALSIRVASLLFKVLLRSESPEFLDLYKKIVLQCGLFKHVWIEELILWCDRRRYFLSQADRQFVIAEIRRNYNISDVKSANLHGLEKFRTHIATISHDAQYNSLDRFKNEKWISPEPTVLDSRVHFIMKKKTCVEGKPQEQLQKFVTDHPGIRAMQLKLAQTALSSALNSPNEVTQDEFRYGFLELLAQKQLT